MPKLEEIKKLEARLWQRVDRRGECWLWMGATNDRGYGQMRAAGRTEYVHRLALALVGRPTPKGMHTDHLCRNPRCVNPEHLEAVSPSVNALRGKLWKGPRRIACPKGHPISAENVYVRPDGYTACRTCCRAAHRKWKESRHEA